MRNDQPVASHAVARSWTWGPAPLASGMEPYADAPDGSGMRLVQYFDKSRMEINNPNGDKSNPFYVTNGLLTVELISGQMQIGDFTFENRKPALFVGQEKGCQAPTRPRRCARRRAGRRGIM